MLPDGEALINGKSPTNKLNFEFSKNRQTYNGGHEKTNEI